jgi:hypothetical protein
LRPSSRRRSITDERGVCGRSAPAPPVAREHAVTEDGKVRSVGPHGEGLSSVPRSCVASSADDHAFAFLGRRTSVNALSVVTDRICGSGLFLRRKTQTVRAARRFCRPNKRCESNRKVSVSVAPRACEPQLS